MAAYSADNVFGVGTNITDYERKICLAAIQRRNELAIMRAPLNVQCEEIAALLLPSHRGTFTYNNTVLPYNKNTDQQVDSNGQVALGRFMSICDSLLTPRNMLWHGLGADDDYVMKDRATSLWFYNTTRKLFKLRYSSFSNFTSQNQGVYQSLGAYGTGVMFVDSFYDIMGRRKSLRYKAIPFGEIYLEQNHQGQYDGFIRTMRMTAQQAIKHPQLNRERLLSFPLIKTALDTNSIVRFNFIHRVCPRDDYNPWRLDMKGKAYGSYYIFELEKILLSEGGYYSFPISATRYQQAPGEQDGRSPAMDVLPALKTLNAEKRVFLKAGHRAADPILLLADDGLMNASLKPGSQNKGGMTSDGRPLVGTIPIGNVQITQEMMQEEKIIIDDVFFVSLFRMAEKTNITATQALEMINEKGIMVAPTVGRQEEYLGNMIYREIDILSQMGELDPMPPRLREANGAYNIIFTSPLSRAMRAQEAAGFFRTIEGVKEIINITGDPTPMDNFNFDRALPDIAEIQSVPPPWMNSVDEKQAIRDARAERAKVQQQIQAAPAAAAMIKAQAVAGKAGLGPAQRSIVPPGQQGIPAIGGV